LVIYLRNMNCVGSFPAVRIIYSLLWLAAAVTAPGQSATNAAPAPGPLKVQPLPESGFDDKLTGGWGGQRNRLADAGISPAAQLVLEGFENSQGGIETGVVGASTFDLNLALDTQKAFGWKGGEFYVDLEDHAGRNPSTVLTGDDQVFDKLNFNSYLQIFEMWYQQELFDGRVRLKIGKVDANTEFCVIDNGLSFLNASTQVTPTITPFPTTPDPMPSADVFLAPADFWYADFMASYANRSDTFGDFTGHPESIQPAQYGTLLIGETGLKWKKAPLFGKDGNLKAGIWYHTGTFTRLEGGQQSGAGGFYGVFDQTLWQPSGEPAQGRGLRGFVEAGRTRGNISVIDWNTSGGLAWTGILAARSSDNFGISVNYAHLSPQAALPHSYELALESFYQAPLLKWATLMPDVQYIIHPGGKYSDALVATLDFTVEF
jgi:porin